MRMAFACSVLALTTALFAQEANRSAQFRPATPVTTGCPVFFGAQVDGRAIARSVEDASLVRWAELTEVRFADRTAWHPAPQARCRAVPSLFHPASAVAQ